MRGIALVLISGCATVDAVEVREPAVEALEVREPAAEAIEPTPAGEGRDMVARIEAPERCAQAARSWLPAAPDEAWRALWCCVVAGRFTALRELVGPDWDPLLRTRHDAPLLLARVIAERGGDVDADLALLHAHGIAIFSLAQALARGIPGAVVLLRGRVTTSGVLDETRLVGARRRNLDLPTGRRLLATGAAALADDEPAVLFGRYDGLRDTDGWPELHVLAAFAPSAVLSY